MSEPEDSAYRQPKLVERGISENVKISEDVLAIKFAEAEGVVIFLDALGTKGVWARTDPKEYTDSWETLLHELDKHNKNLKTLSEWSNVTSSIHAFSDTIIITIRLLNKDSNTTVFESDRLLFYAARLISPMLLNGIFKGIYLKGVISVGQFFESQTSIIGPAVDEAADWYEKIEWIGVSSAPTAHFTLEKLFEVKQDISKWYVKYPVPMKAGITTEVVWAVNWPALYLTYSDKEAMSLKALILNKFASRPISSDAVTKFHNTIKFYDNVTSKK